MPHQSVNYINSIMPDLCQRSERVYRDLLPLHHMSVAALLRQVRNKVLTPAEIQGSNYTAKYGKEEVRRSGRIYQSKQCDKSALRSLRSIFA
jgi:hypothetical protein